MAALLGPSEFSQDRVPKPRGLARKPALGPDSPKLGEISLREGWEIDGAPDHASSFPNPAPRWARSATPRPAAGLAGASEALASALPYSHELVAIASADPCVLQLFWAYS
ncbi:MAG: hypothetical protein AAGB51_14100 [Planctomycetota bacterium]